MGCGISKAGSPRKVANNGQTITKEESLRQSSESFLFQSHLSELLQDVIFIAKPPTINPVVCISPNSFPIVTSRLYLNDQMTDLALPIVAGTCYNNGRVVCFGDIMYIIDENRKSHDTSRLIYNTLKWTVNKERTSKPALILGFPKDIGKDFESFLNKHQVQAFIGNAQSNYNDYQLIIIASSYQPENRLVDFVSNGGAMVCFYDSTIEDESDFALNPILTMFGLAFTYCSLSIGDSSSQQIRINKYYNEISNINFEFVMSKYQNELLKPTINNATLDDLVTLLRFYIIVCGAPQTEKIMLLTKCTWDFLLRTQYRTDKGFCPQIYHGMATILLVQLIYKIPPEEIRPAIDISEFPGITGNVNLSKFNLTLKIPSLSFISTGLWLPAGTVGRVIVEKPNSSILVQVGSQQESLLAKQGPWKRWPNVVLTFNLANEETVIATPFGGIVYLYYDNASHDVIDSYLIKFDGFCKHPKAIYSDPSIWESTKDIDVPWGEIDARTIVFTVPSNAMRKIADMNVFFKRMKIMVQYIREFTSVKISRPYRVVFDIDQNEDAPVCTYPLIFPLNDVEKYLLFEEPNGYLLSFLRTLTIVSIRENCFDSATETALATIAASSAIKKIWPDYNPLVDKDVNCSILFKELWVIHDMVDPTVLPKTLEIFQNPEYGILDTPDDMWIMFVHHMCQIGRKDFIQAMQKAKPVPLNITLSLQGLPAYVPPQID